MAGDGADRQAVWRNLSRNGGSSGSCLHCASDMGLQEIEETANEVRRCVRIATTSACHALRVDALPGQTVGRITDGTFVGFGEQLDVLGHGHEADACPSFF